MQGSDNSNSSGGRASLSTLTAELLTTVKAMGLSGLPEVWFKQQVKEELLVEVGNKPAIETAALLDTLSGGTLSDSYAHLDLSELEKLASECRKCRLCETRNKVVFGVGNTARPLIAFVGEGPGAEEDKKGEPFVGKAGMLLTAAITKGMGLRREDVYIANVVKCRPPENRTPLPDEVEACTPYLFRQLEIIQPKVVVTLGQPAQLALSGVKQGITKLRGQWQEWRGFKLMPTFHPAYLLRNPPAKKFFWEDLQSVMTEVGLPIPKSGLSG